MRGHFIIFMSIGRCHALMRQTLVRLHTKPPSALSTPLYQLGKTIAPPIGPDGPATHTRGVPSALPKTSFLP